MNSLQHTFKQLMKIPLKRLKELYFTFLYINCGLEPETRYNLINFYRVQDSFCDLIELF